MLANLVTSGFASNSCRMTDVAALPTAYVVLPAAGSHSSQGVHRIGLQDIKRHCQYLSEKTSASQEVV